jgi:uncharacterized protein YndB with AHSA1/START domain
MHRPTKNGALTEPELLARWLALNDIRAEPGTRFRF